MRLARPRQTVDQLLREIRRTDVKSAIAILHLEQQTALMISHGRDNNLVALLDVVIAGEVLDPTVALQLPSAPAVGFAPVLGSEAKTIALAGARAMQAGNWISRALKTGVFGKHLRGVTALVIEKSGEPRAASVGDKPHVVPTLVAAREALRILRSRSNRGVLSGPYWYRARGPAAAELLPAPEPPSALQELFAEEPAAAGGSKNEA